MHFKTKSLAVVLAVVVIMIGIGFLIGKTNSITGAVTAKCICDSDSACNDNNECTVDACLYPDSCAASRCINTKKAECVQ